jgi:hypothetical protein
MTKVICVLIFSLFVLGTNIQSFSQIEVKGSGNTGSTFTFISKNSNSDTSLVIRDDGKIGIGITQPLVELEINGQIKITGGTPGEDKVLTSNADGLASWETISNTNSWNILGNSGLNPSTNFIGTIDNVVLNFRVNNQKAGIIDPAGSVFFGNQAGKNNTFSTNCTGIGTYALYSNSGCCNAAIGAYALYANGSGQSNTAIGVDALKKNISGSENSACGSGALFNNTSGYWNTGDGFQSLYSNTSGYYNTALGHGAFYNGSSFYNSTALGYNTEITASNQVRIGNSNVTSIGGFVNWTNLSDGRCKKDISETVPGLEFILKLRPVTYHLDMEAIAILLHLSDHPQQVGVEKEINNFLQTGFIAQDVEKAAKECEFDFSGVDKPKNANDLYGLRYAEFTIPLVKAVQELNTMVINQQAVIGEQSRKIESLEMEIQDLKTKFDTLEIKIEHSK